MLKVGDVVKLTTLLLGNSPETIGFVFNDELNIQQIIFENGKYDGFDLRDQTNFLEKIGHEDSLTNYQFINVFRTGIDYDYNLFPFKRWK
jgi:hypothetical protein